MSDALAVAVARGRLADPTTSPATDPRIDRRLRALLADFQLDGLGEPAPLDASADLDAIGQFAGGADEAFNGLYDALPLDLPGDEEISFEEQTVASFDGYELTLRIFGPSQEARAGGPVPCVAYIHGGGMTILRTNARVHLRWCQSLASAGVVAVSVDFRNAWTAAGHHPFPTGLRDCAAAIDWIHAHRDDLGIGALVVHGESGGANLSLASALKAKQEGRLDRIDGVYANVPYVSGAYGWPAERRLAELPSLAENDGYFIACDLMAPLARYYGPADGNSVDPLVWPAHATVDDVRGLPPHVISVNELDPLRDEGLAYYRKLLAADVTVTGRVNLGITHAAELIFRKAIPDVNAAAIADIVAFASRV